MRCKYCTYNEHFDEERGFVGENIDFETAKKAIDYAYANRHPEQFAVTFYGGEPLINFSVMRQCIDYCCETFTDTDITFSLTTNLTLVTTEIAEYLAQIPNLSILASLDGPAEIQNENRVFANGQASFDSAFNGLKLICEAMNIYHDPLSSLAISTVLMPPYTFERFDQINEFFESLDFVPEHTRVVATYPTRGSVPDGFLEELKKKGYNPDADDSWMDWSLEVAAERGKLVVSPNIHSKYLVDLLFPIHQRRLAAEPLDRFPCNGNCVPTQRRIYVCTDGSYQVCEKIGYSPSIGDVDNGIDWEIIKEYYIRQYDEKSLPECSQCWAVFLCDVCYAECMSKDGLNSKRKKKLCDSTRENAVVRLAMYHHVLEQYPHLVEELAAYRKN